MFLPVAAGDTQTFPFGSPVVQFLLAHDFGLASRLRFQVLRRCNDCPQNQLREQKKTRILYRFHVSFVNRVSGFWQLDSSGSLAFSDGGGRV